MEPPPSPFLEKVKARGGFSYPFMPGLGLLLIAGLKSFKDYTFVAYMAYWSGIIRDKKYFLNEPAFTVQVSYRALKGRVQIVYAVDATDAEFAQENVNLNLGLYLALPAPRKASK